jgi:hypothetical protein
VPVNVQGDGGAVGETGSVKNVVSRDTILVKSDGSTVDAATISATDGIYGIDFSFTLPKTDWRASVIQVSASNYAGFIQQLAQQDHVTAVWYAPDTNAAGLLIDTVVVVVESTSGLSDTQIEYKLQQFSTPATFDRIQQTTAHLDAIEALG